VSRSVRIYLDHNATTPLHPAVSKAMARVLREPHGNPSSTHAEGAAAREQVERARVRVAALVGVEPDEVVFTAGATEANNTALRGALRARGGAPGHVVCSAVEHPSVDAPLRALEAEGWRVSRVPVGADGRVEASAMSAAVRDDTALISLIWANNETGVVQPVQEVAELARQRGVPFHSDATQALGKLPVDLHETPVDLLALSAHKLNGPTGVGCLVARRGVAWEPLLLGGPQERRRRGGTENVTGIVGLGVACERAREERAERARVGARLRDRLWDGIRSKVAGVRRNGSDRHVLPNTLNVEFEGVAGEVLLQALDLEGIAASAGSACASGSIEPSAVLLAMGRSPESAGASLRFSVGLGNDDSQIDRVLALLPDLVERARGAPGA
jgi:cysteine desulfurase